VVWHHVTFLIAFVAFFGSNRPPIQASTFACQSCVGVTDGVEEIAVAPDPAAVVGRTGPFTFHVERVFHLGGGGRTAPEHDLMLPAVTEIVLEM